ncbi:hypothetical protein ACFL6I_14810 [candidate division KSB1 bacterium]
MTEDNKIEKTLIEQILDETLSNIRKHEDFDPSTIAELKELAQTEHLKKSEEIIKKIQSSRGDEK